MKMYTRLGVGTQPCVLEPLSKKLRRDFPLQQANRLDSTHGICDLGLTAIRVHGRGMNEGQR